MTLTKYRVALTTRGWIALAVYLTGSTQKSVSINIKGVCGIQLKVWVQTGYPKSVADNVRRISSSIKLFFLVKRKKSCSSFDNEMWTETFSWKKSHFRSHCRSYYQLFFLGIDAIKEVLGNIGRLVADNVHGLSERIVEKKLVEIISPKFTIYQIDGMWYKF